MAVMLLMPMLSKCFIFKDENFRPVALEVDDSNQWIFVGTQQEIRLISIKNGTVKDPSLNDQAEEGVVPHKKEVVRMFENRTSSVLRHFTFGPILEGLVIGQKFM